MNKPDEASAVEGLDWGRELFRIANMSVEERKAAPLMQMVEQRKIRALLHAYEMAERNTNARIPSPLRCAIEALK